KSAFFKAAKDISKKANLLPHRERFHGDNANPAFDNDCFDLRLIFFCLSCHDFRPSKIGMFGPAYSERNMLLFQWCDAEKMYNFVSHRFNFLGVSVVQME